MVTPLSEKVNVSVKDKQVLFDPKNLTCSDVSGV